MSNAKAAKAFVAMKALGISEKKVKPVLKNLLKLYDKNWALIEDENYRVLADAIFEFDEAKVDEPNEDAQLHDDSGPPLKRLRLRHQKEQASGLGESSSKRPKLEGGDLQQNCPREETTEMLQPYSEERSFEPDAISPQMHLSDKNKEHSSPRACPGNESSEPTQLQLLEKRTEPETISPRTRLRDKGKEPVLSPGNGYRQEREEPSRLCLRIRENGAESDSVSPQVHHRDTRNELIPSQIVPRQKKMVSWGLPSVIYLKQPKIEPDIDLLPQENLASCDQNNASSINPKTAPSTAELPQFEVPIAVIHPPKIGPAIHQDPLHRKDCLVGNGSGKKPDGQELAPPNPGVKVKDTGLGVSRCEIGPSLELGDIPEESHANLEIASSTSGEVKISLSCNYAHGRPNFHLPSLDAVMKMVEDKCLKSFKISEPNFSLTKLMKEVCQCYLDMGTDSTNDKQESTIQISPNIPEQKITPNIPEQKITPNLDLLEESNMKCFLGAKDAPGTFHIPGNASNGSLNFQCSTQVVIPQIPRLLALNGLDDIHGVVQPNQEVPENIHGEMDQMKVQKHPDSSSSSELALLLHQKVDLEDIRPLHDVNDLSKGEENLKISLVNEVSSEPYPPLFYYIPRNIVYHSADVKFSIARIGDEDCCSNCFGDCLSSSIPCACARETGGDFAYTLEGLVKEKFLDECVSMNRDAQQHRLFYCDDCPVERCKKEDLSEPCKGHIMRKFIKECWSKCGCNKLCGNRVVQRGITCNLQVFLTPDGKGWGLRALQDLPRGTFVCEYVGEIITSKELYERNVGSTESETQTYPVMLDADWGSEVIMNDEKALYLDATFYGNVARFINHRCFDANLVEIPIEVETPNHHYYHLAFFTTRKVDALEELTWDYGIDFDVHNHDKKGFRCRCGSKCCRDMKHPRKTKHNPVILR